MTSYANKLIIIHILFWYVIFIVTLTLYMKQFWSLSSHLLDFLSGQHSKADTLDEILRETDFELNKFLNAFNDLYFVWVLAFASSFNLQLLSFSVERETHDASLSIGHFNLLDWRSQFAVMSESSITELRGLSSIGLSKAKRFNVGTDAPL